MTITREQRITGAIIGLAVGDALGVPVEFQRRSVLRGKPVTDYIAFGVHNQPAGTWSDDTSLAMCLAESLLGGYDLHDIAQSFCRWRRAAHWTAHGVVFDIGIATSAAIDRLEDRVSPQVAGGDGETSNGNGSLMRIMPLLPLIEPLPPAERRRLIQEVSSVTHRHIRSVFACLVYLEFARALLQGASKQAAWEEMNSAIAAHLAEVPIDPSELAHFRRILTGDILNCAEPDVQSSGYVVHTLEASLWCFMNGDSYEESVLAAVNLGDDTDTTGAVTGALCGLYYGIDAIPERWRAGLARHADILGTARSLAQQRW